MEGRAAAGACAVDLDRSGVPLDQVLYDGESQPEAAGERVALAIDLHERLENAPSLVGRNPAAVVAHRYAYAPRKAIHDDVDRALRGRELGRIRQQVPEHLCETHWVAPNDDSARVAQRQPVAATRVTR